MLRQNTTHTTTIDEYDFRYFIRKEFGHEFDIYDVEDPMAEMETVYAVPGKLTVAAKKTLLAFRKHGETTPQQTISAILNFAVIEKHIKFPGTIHIFCDIY